MEPTERPTEPTAEQLRLPAASPRPEPAQPAPIRPGYRTTEFWLSAAASVVGLLLAADVLAPGSAAGQVVGVLASALAAMGYSVSRSRVKG
jgi:hypothetical protein